MSNQTKNCNKHLAATQREQDDIDDVLDGIACSPYEPPPAPRGATPEFIEIPFNNRSSSDCSRDLENGFMKTGVMHKWEKGYVERAQYLPVYDGKMNPMGAAVVVPDEYMDKLAFEFKVSVEAIIRRRRKKGGALIVLPSTRIFEWFVAGKITHRIEYPQSKATTIFEFQRAVDVLNKIGCNYLLGVKIEDGHRVEIFNPWFNETYILSKRDIAKGWAM